MSGVAYVDRGATATSSGTSITANYPATVSANDIAYLRLSAPNGASAAPTTPAGFTLLAHVDNVADGGAVGMWLYWKRCAGTESGGTVPITTGTAATWSATLSTYSGARTTGNPYAHVVSGTSGGPATSITTAALTVDSSGPSGTSFEVVAMQGDTAGSGLYSAEVWDSLGAVAGTNVERRDANGSLSFTQQSSSGSSSTFTVTTSNHSYVYVLTDLVEAPASSNHAPVANAGPDQTHAAGTLIQLDGSASSDVDGDTLTYAWSHISGPYTGSLSNPSLAKPTYTPTTSGADVWQLVVTDTHAASSPADTVSITATNRKPVAVPGAAQTVAVGTSVVLDGRGSFDPDTGDTITYAWSGVSGPNATGASSSAGRFTYTAAAAGTDVWQLVVTDSNGVASDAVTVAVTVGADGVRGRVNGQWFEFLCKERSASVWVQV